MVFRCSLMLDAGELGFFEIFLGLADVGLRAWMEQIESFGEAKAPGAPTFAGLLVGDFPSRIAPRPISASDASWRFVDLRVPESRTGSVCLPAWAPPSAGSQRSLVPDLVMEREDVVVVLDAKYKRHAEEIERLGWANADEVLREHHRNDVLQALAYSALFDAPRVVACLVYPASPTTWQSARRARQDGPAREGSERHAERGTGADGGAAVG